MLLTSGHIIDTIGTPEKSAPKHCSILEIAAHVRTAIPALPGRIYCNNAMHVPLTRALASLVTWGLSHRIHTYDGCFNIRHKRGASSLSLHSWGLAIDINALTNRFCARPTTPNEVVMIFYDEGFDWGDGWSMPDGMHFQLSRIAFDDFYHVRP